MINAELLMAVPHPQASNHLCCVLANRAKILAVETVVDPLWPPWVITGNKLGSFLGVLAVASSTIQASIPGSAK